MKELRPEQKGHVFVPGTVVELNHGEISVTQTLYTDAEIDRIFDDKWAYLAEQRDSRQAEIAAEEASRAAVLPPDEMLAALKEWWEPLLRRGRIFRDGVGGPVRYTIGDLDMVVDFPKAKVREYAGEETSYWFTIPADLVSTNIRDREIDWSNSIFLSMQFAAGRVGKFNEFIYTFMKCLSRDRIEYVENWYAEQSDVSEDVQLGEWVVQRRCPHLRADLSKTAQDRGRRPHLQPARLEVGPDDAASASRRRATRSARVRPRTTSRARRSPPPADRAAAIASAVDAHPDEERPDRAAEGVAVDVGAKTCRSHRCGEGHRDECPQVLLGALPPAGSR